MTRELDPREAVVIGVNDDVATADALDFLQQIGGVRYDNAVVPGACGNVTGTEDFLWMAEALKSFFDPDLVRRLATDMKRAEPSFRSPSFMKMATAGMDGLELLDRARHISRALAAHLSPYPEAVEILLRSLGPAHATEELLGVGMAQALTCVASFPRERACVFRGPAASRGSTRTLDRCWSCWSS